MTPDSEEHGGSCLHTNTMQSRNISRTLICLDCGKRDPQDLALPDASRTERP